MLKQQWQNKMARLFFIGFCLLIGTDIAARLITVAKHQDFNWFFYTNPFFDLFEPPREFPKLNPFLVIPPATYGDFNEEGFRANCSAFEAKPPEQVRIFFLGSSAIENIPTENLVERLASAFPEKQICIYNCGTAGYSTNQALVRLATDLIHLKPDIIVVNHSWTDFTELFHFGADTVAFVRNAKYFHPRYFPFFNRSFYMVEDLQNESVIGRLIRSRFLNYHRGLNIFFSRIALFYERKPERNPVELSAGLLERGLNEYKSNLRAMAALCRAFDCRLIFSSQPINLDRDTYYTGYERVQYDVNYPKFEQLEASLQAYDNVLKEMALQDNSTYIPLKEEFLGTKEPKLFFIDMVHLNRAGIEKYLDFCYGYLKEEISLCSGLQNSKGKDAEE